MREFSFHPITGAPRKFARVRFQSHAPGTKPAHLPTSHHPPPPLPFGSNLSNCKHYQPPGGRFEISRGPVRGTTPFQIFLWQHGPGVQAVEFADANLPLAGALFATQGVRVRGPHLLLLPRGAGPGAKICYLRGPDLWATFAPAHPPRELPQTIPESCRSFAAASGSIKKHHTGLRSRFARIFFPPYHRGSPEIC